MWTRAELKEKAKLAMNRNYWYCVLAGFLISLIAGGSGYLTMIYNAGSSAGTDVASWEGFFQYGTLDWKPFGLFGIFAVILAMFSAVLSMAWTYLVVQPIQEVGSSRFFIENACGQTNIGKLFFAFSSGHFLKLVWALFLRSLFVTLWSFLFLVPGIIKYYEYRMVPYLLADCPQMDRKSAFRISKELMRGQKWNVFVLDLSFLGWDILSALTFGILQIFYVTPYKYATHAELFLELKQQYFAGRE